MQWNQLLNYLSPILLIWVLGLTFFLFRAERHYKKITGGQKNQNIDQILEKLISTQSSLGGSIKSIFSELEDQKRIQKNNFSKYAITRFNPFEDTGGDQSFVMVLLDSSDNGIVISSLHSRNGTRVYAKEVVGAKPKSHQFSKEEREVVEKAAARQV